MVKNNEGLTKTYNRFHDPDERSPDILRLRDLHAALDRAVLDAYGWTDLKPTCEFLLDYEEDDDEDEAGGGRHTSLADGGHIPPRDRGHGSRGRVRPAFPRTATNAYGRQNGCP